MYSLLVYSGTLNIEAACSSKTFVAIYQTMPYRSPENQNLYYYRPESFNTHNVVGCDSIQAQATVLIYFNIFLAISHTPLNRDTTVQLTDAINTKHAMVNTDFRRYTSSVMLLFNSKSIAA